MRKISIKGTGSSVPEKVVPNSYFEEILDTTSEWIKSRTGIEERRMLEPGECLSTLGIPASQAAIEMAGIDPKDLDLIIVGTSTGDMVTPSTACFIQEALGAKKAAAFDLAAACPGFIYSLGVAEKFIKDSSHDLVLVIGGEVMSSWIDYQDRGTCVLFGDGAGAAVLGPKEDGELGELLSTHMHADGSLWELLNVPGGGSLHPPSIEMLEARLPYIKMQGTEVFKYAVRTMEEVCLEALSHNGYTIDDIDWLVPHQANLRIMETTAKRLNIPLEKVVITVNKYGNTSAGTIPVALDEAVRDERIKRGQLVLLTAFGAGFTWAASLLRF